MYNFSYCTFTLVEGKSYSNLILRKFKKAPICALKMTKNLDEGPIYLKENVSLDGKLSEIFSRIA